MKAWEFVEGDSAHIVWRVAHGGLGTPDLAGKCSDAQFVVALNSWGKTGSPHEFRTTTNANSKSLKSPRSTFEIHSILPISLQGSGVLRLLIGDLDLTHAEQTFDFEGRR